MDRRCNLDIWRKPGGTSRLARSKFLIKNCVWQTLNFTGVIQCLARFLPETFRLIQAEHVAHRDQILREPGQ